MNIYIRQEHSVPPAMSYNSSWEEVITFLQIQYIYVALAPIGLISVCLYKSYGRIKPKQTNINHTSYQNIFSLAFQTSNNHTYKIILMLSYFIIISYCLHLLRQSHAWKINSHNMLSYTFVKTTHIANSARIATLLWNWSLHRSLFFFGKKKNHFDEYKENFQTKIINRFGINVLYGRSPFVIHRETISWKCQLRSCNYLAEDTGLFDFIYCPYLDSM